MAPPFVFVATCGVTPIARAPSTNSDERGAILLTSNQRLGAWGEVFGDAVIASAILDRLLDHATTVNIKGDSYRLRKRRKAGLMKSTLTPHPEA